MRVAVVSCMKYSDCWKPFMRLLDIYWPDCPYPVDWITDQDREDMDWCRLLAEYAGKATEAICLFQEDFLLTAPVKQDLIERALEQMEARKAGMVRLYPCPGADAEYGDAYYGLVQKGSRFRISCQASIWRPSFLYTLAANPRFKTAHDFEIHGTEMAEKIADEVLAYRREVEPWPLQYLCSAITKGYWEPTAKTLCDQHGITVDWEKRGFTTVHA